MDQSPYFQTYSGITTSAFNSKGRALLGVFLRENDHLIRVLQLSFCVIRINYATAAVTDSLMHANHLESQLILKFPSKQIYIKVAIYATLVNTCTNQIGTISQPIGNKQPSRWLFELATRTGDGRFVSVFQRTVLVLSNVVVAAATALRLFLWVMVFTCQRLDICHRSICMLFEPTDEGQR